MVFLRWKRLFSSKIHSIKNSRPTICIYWVSRFIFDVFEKWIWMFLSVFEVKSTIWKTRMFLDSIFKLYFKNFRNLTPRKIWSPNIMWLTFGKTGIFDQKIKYFSMKNWFLIDKWRFLSRKYQFFIQKMRYFYCPSFHSRCRFICSVFISM